MTKSRFKELCALQYERWLTPLEKAEFSLLSGEKTFNDRVASGIPVNLDSAARIRVLQDRYETLLQEKSP